MKTLLSTTALVLALSLPTFVQAQTSEAAPAATTANVDMPGFLAGRGQSDVFASELMGHDVYARRTAGPGNAGNGQAIMADNGMHDMAMMNRADLDTMDNIGQINEVVLSSRGQVRALVIGVGGFLGMGEQDVAVTMDQITFATDPDDRTKMYVVVNTGADMLKGSPKYQRRAMANEATAQATDATATTTATDQANTTATDREVFVAPKVERDGYKQIPVTEMSSEMLVGKDVYGVNDKSVGTIDDLIVDDKGVITNVIIDFGGFLGMGTSQVSVGFEELTILADDGRTDVRVYVDATKEQVQAQPQYQAIN